MYTLVLDTSYQYLAIGIYQSEQLIDSVEYLCLRRQSEETLEKLNELCVKNNIEPLQITKIIVSKGPGSYTGVRIGLTIAKVVAIAKKATIYTLSTLQLYQGLNQGYCILDARSDKVFIGYYKQHEYHNEIVSIEQAKQMSKDCQVYGDSHLVDKNASSISIVKNFMILKNYWEKVENPNLLVPLYLK